mmetsp:Transcript_17742/g.54157  ORF Transcript_17742/g.54157 Transcript_17742/m.54157 type:complete len:92 (-) Transcript_17742:1171-1446(-)
MGRRLRRRLLQIRRRPPRKTLPWNDETRQEGRVRHIIPTSDARRPCSSRLSPSSVVGLFLLSGLGWWLDRRTDDSRASYLNSSAPHNIVVC